jgi:hypothetical protein
MSKRTCDLCGERLEEEPLVHDLLKCEHTELIKGRQEIIKLKKSVDEYKDAWYQGRENLGWLWWHHPAITSDEKRAYYQEVVAGFKKEQGNEPRSIT